MRTNGTTCGSFFAVGCSLARATRLDGWKDVWDLHEEIMMFGAEDAFGKELEVEAVVALLAQMESAVVVE